MTEQVFKLSTKKIIKVLVDDKEFQVRKPNVSDQKRLSDMQKGLSQDSPEQIDVMINWISSLGLPKEIVEQMDQSDLVKLIEDYLVDVKKK